MRMRGRWMWSLVMALFPVAVGAAPPVTCLEQAVIREQVEGQPALKGQQRICFDDKRIRNEMVWGKLRTVAIFDLAANRVQLIPGKDPEYVELSLPDYRQLVALRLSGIGLDDEQAQPSLKNSSETQTIHGWNCTRLDFKQAGRLPVHTELWVTREAGVDFAAWLRLMDAMGLTAAFGRLGSFVDQIDGLPVLVRTEQSVAGQRLVTTTELLRVTHPSDESALFELPAGLVRIEAGPIPVPEGDDGNPAGPPRPSQGG